MNPGINLKRRHQSCGGQPGLYFGEFMARNAGQYQTTYGLPDTKSDFTGYCGAERNGHERQVDGGSGATNRRRFFREKAFMNWPVHLRRK